MKEKKNKTEELPVRPELTTIVGKKGDSVIIEVRNLPKDFSFAYILFRNVEQECCLLKSDIEKAQTIGDINTVAYLEAAQLFLNGHPVPRKYYLGGIRIPPILDVIRTLAFNGQLLSTNSVALCVKNRIDDEIKIIRQEYEYCKMLSSIMPHKIEQVITIIRRANTEEDAVEKLQSELSLTVGEAECLCTASLSTITDTELVAQKMKSMNLLLAYLQYLKTINL